MDSNPSTSIDRHISRRFWDDRALLAHDIRSVTLSPARLSRIGLSVFQGWFRRVLALYLPRPELAVDLGCGNGQWTELLARLAPSVTAFDLSPLMVEACRRRLEAAGLGAGLTAKCADAAEAEIPPGADLVVAGAVTQYLSDAEINPFFLRVRRALAPHGVFYVRTSVSRTGAIHSTLTDSFQGIYRPTDWYEERFAAAGFQILGPAHALDSVPAEISARLGRWAFHPLRALWRVLLWRRNTEVAVWFLRPAKTS